ncbi:hypothetical protein H4219_005016 [Mycoemilia scoparia]|uniref:F-box domain-containing protein n=1 Tax=Mycoemilia scoparia TaxID=417184 RepID=A0A9W7ZVH4_9FUNG|nr:hypothetical protein H4219_005016 [Mycoemilia scoparia]
MYNKLTAELATKITEYIHHAEGNSTNCYNRLPSWSSLWELGKLSDEWKQVVENIQYKQENLPEKVNRECLEMVGKRKLSYIQFLDIRSCVNIIEPPPTPSQISLLPIYNNESQYQDGVVVEEEEREGQGEIGLINPNRYYYHVELQPAGYLKCLKTYFPNLSGLCIPLKKEYLKMISTAKNSGSNVCLRKIHLDCRYPRLFGYPDDGSNNSDEIPENISQLQRTENSLLSALQYLPNSATELRLIGNAEVGINFILELSEIHPQLQMLYISTFQVSFDTGENSTINASVANKHTRPKSAFAYLKSIDIQQLKVLVPHINTPSNEHPKVTNIFNSHNLPNLQELQIHYMSFESMDGHLDIYGLNNNNHRHPFGNQNMRNNRDSAQLELFLASMKSQCLNNIFAFGYDKLSYLRIPFMSTNLAKLTSRSCPNLQYIETTGFVDFSIPRHNRFHRFDEPELVFLDDDNDDDDDDGNEDVEEIVNSSSDDDDNEDPQGSESESEPEEEEEEEGQNTAGRAYTHQDHHSHHQWMLQERRRDQSRHNINRLTIDIPQQQQPPPPRRHIDLNAGLGRQRVRAMFGNVRPIERRVRFQEPQQQQRLEFERIGNNLGVKNPDPTTTTFDDQGLIHIVYSLKALKVLCIQPQAFPKVNIGQDLDGLYKRFSKSKHKDQDNEFGIAENAKKRTNDVSFSTSSYIIPKMAAATTTTSAVGKNSKLVILDIKQAKFLVSQIPFILKRLDSLRHINIAISDSEHFDRHDYGGGDIKMTQRKVNRNTTRNSNTTTTTTTSAAAAAVTTKSTFKSRLSTSCECMAITQWSRTYKFPSINSLTIDLPISYYHSFMYCQKRKRNSKMDLYQFDNSNSEKSNNHDDFMMSMDYWLVLFSRFPNLAKVQFNIQKNCPAVSAGITSGLGYDFALSPMFDYNSYGRRLHLRHRNRFTRYRENRNVNLMRRTRAGPVNDDYINTTDIGDENDDDDGSGHSRDDSERRTRQRISETIANDSDGRDSEIDDLGVPEELHTFPNSNTNNNNNNNNNSKNRYQSMTTEFLSYFKRDFENIAFSI